MSTRRPILFPAICLALAVFCAATAQPLQPEGDNEFGGTPGMHLFLQSRFIRTHQADRLHFARMRHYREGYLDAVGHGVDRDLISGAGLVQIHGMDGRDLAALDVLPGAGSVQEPDRFGSCGGTVVPDKVHDRGG